jgi:TRAP-type C4-dicarboxylate transport system permease large subunit
MVRRNPALAPESAPIVVDRKPVVWWQWLLALALVAVAAWMTYAESGVLQAALATGKYRAAVSEMVPQAALLALSALCVLVDATVMPAIFIALVVVGGIYGGVFTPTEGAAVGAIAMLAVGVGQGSLGGSAIFEAVRQTAETSGMIFMILLGAEVFGAFLALSRLPTMAAELVGASGYSAYTVMIAMLLFYVLLGAVMDELAMILLTLPVFFPVVQSLDFGMFPDDVAIWFGILVLIVVGFGLTCPPIGLNVFVVSSVARDVPITATYRGVLPFLVADVVRLGLVLAFPMLALWMVRMLQ